MISRSRLTDDADSADNADNSIQIVYPKGVEIFRVDGDVLHSVCSCPLLAPDVCGRLVAVATPKNGILEFATHPDVASASGYGNSYGCGHDELASPGAGPFHDTPRYESPRHDAGMFSKLVSQIFDQASWVTDPLENQSVMIDGDVGLAAGAARASSSPSAAAAAGAASPQSRRLQASLSAQSPTPQRSPSTDAKRTVSKMLVAHPYRQLFLSGCKDTARIKLWQYDGPRPLRLFTPVPHHDLQQLASMNHDMFSMSANFAKSQSLASKMSHWGKAVDMCFSENGQRFASIGQGGVVAVWSLDSSFTNTSVGTDVDGATCSEWWHTCLEAQGRSVSFVGGSSAVVAAAGQCNAGNVSMWNTSLPERGACVGRLRNHKAAVNKVKTLPGGWLLAAADDAGTLSVSDVRMLGSDRDPVIWSTKACKGVIRAMDTISYESGGWRRPPSASRRHHFMPGNDTAIVTGGDDGIVRLWDVNTGTLIQQSERVHTAAASTPRLLSLAGAPSAKYAISGLAVCDEGIITSGTDGVVRLLPRLL